MLDEIMGSIDKVASVVDENIFTEQERAEILTQRLEIDANSDNQLAKMIRPIVTLITCAVWVFVHIASVFHKISPEVLYSCDAAFMTCIGFYFDSRRREKINQRKIIAAIKIEKEKLSQQRIQNRREARLERIRARKDNR
ncbi:hypothetical protein LCGC14_1287250 [marine sediment metagenome]|uniref:Uncharacterized protein n=1 Tax=marine sediment metagenome TaxID=412755 RepID=A0A0F9NWF7_9ZZZZ